MLNYHRSLIQIWSNSGGKSYNEIQRMLDQLNSEESARTHDT